MKNREQHLLTKFLGLVGRMRKHQKAYFAHRMEYDKKQAIIYEKQVDDYIRLLLKDGYKPFFEDGQPQLPIKNL